MLLDASSNCCLVFRISSLSSMPCSFCAVRKVSCAISFSAVAVASWVFNWVTVCVASSRSWLAELCSCCVCCLLVVCCCLFCWACMSALFAVSIVFSISCSC
ncbi:membrane protein [Bathymodiolus azoricus thioautotrophic gill symbiont]|uniref:Membrane protein n=1 Tax=Bathymodiolus azoricus thioautotrophic gill symbiont TaxID=235205 RepID=A0A1H6KGX0_9GAMM|nr:membrane protein [Bathymodiolus azoricus thioautotrophic gill symbiont]